MGPYIWRHIYGAIYMVPYIYGAIYMAAHNSRLNSVLIAS